MKLPIQKILSGVMFLSLASACAGAKIKNVQTGMSRSQVYAVMGNGGTMAQPYSDGYESVYWKDSACVLFKDDKVVAKSRAETKTKISIPGVGGFKEKTLAECLPPNMAPQSETKKKINIGIGGASTTGISF